MPIPVNINLRLKLTLWLLGALLPLALGTAVLLLWISARDAALSAQEAVSLVAVIASISAVSIAGTFLLFLFPLARRIKQATTDAEQLARGTLLKAHPDTASDELGRLSRSLVQIAHSSSEESVKLERDKQNLSHQATHDELTGLSNRKHGNATIARLDSTAGDAPTSILFLDLDGFKAVNDTCGHAIGDEILVAVSLRLKATLRSDCIPIRWGGDEFVIVLPGSDKRGAISVAQDVAGLFTHPFATSEGVHKLGCSIGLSTSRPNTSLEKVLEEADSSMYDQKKKRKSVRGRSSEESSSELPDEDWDQAA